MKAVEQELGQEGVEIVDSGLAFKFVPDKDELEKCVEFGREVALSDRKALSGTGLQLQRLSSQIQWQRL